MIHLQRVQYPSGRLTLLVIAPHSDELNAVFRRHHGRYAPSTGVWEVEASLEGVVLRALDAVFGLQWLCPVCAYGFRCPLSVPQPGAQQRKQPFEGRRTRREAPKQLPAQMSRFEAAKILGVKSTSTPDEVKRAFATKALKAHSDTGGDDERMKRVLEARRVLLES